MSFIEKSGRTVDEAVESALAELNVQKDEVEIEVIEEPSKGLFGFIGVKPARVKVKIKETAARQARELLGKIMSLMNLDVDIDIIEKDEKILVNINGPDLGILIGRRGETLDALQYLVNLSANKNMEKRKRIFIDIEGYRKRREDTLKKLAYKLADKARQRGRNVILEPMNSMERRIIHTALQGRDDIYTFSEGEEPYRKIIIAPKK
ncbi:RNA-binding cell elongation regulator Jag/EloR [Desulfallas thermosapovorans]|uniref:RNA-binding protein KhpB n=1 Tax=Desulfallas thermosapovorans DSM 6562 TaxID=1121431 RepID=A0A5S4ZUP1_9FIRM|nr:RNA-binding cell elongation regulator Jag/EloR [Desulfallas thermosapovorans]TYO96421.1 spoIIIJ-associated protein [Desulfallas thermosapovorans DSM 6562]